MICVIFGPPGSGKGTQAAALCERFELAHVSTGDMLREAVRNETELGKQAKEIMDQGKLVSDELVAGIVRDKVAELNEAGKGILFDGYPRNVDQAKTLDSILGEFDLSVDVVAVLEVPASALVKRICGRRLCTNPECDGSFNIHFMPPKKEGICDKCGSELMQRKDDNEETLRERLEVYAQQTMPILDYYGEKDLLIRVDANVNVDDVRNALISGIERKTGK
ncbi:MAG: adenylate kinase [Candidatus Sumerlaeia bacterium]